MIGIRWLFSRKIAGQNLPACNICMASGAIVLNLFARLARGGIMKKGSFVIAGLMIVFFLGANVLGQDTTSDLFEAIELGDKGLINTLLQKGENVNATLESGETPLFAAVRSKNLDITKLLLEKGAKVNVADRSGETPLMLAARTGNLEIAKLLLDKGAEINARDVDQYTALSYAKGFRKPEMVVFLKSHGAEEAPAKPLPKIKKKYVLPKFPEFPWPPPKPSAFAKIPRSLLVKGESQTKLGDVADRLENAFNLAGYGEKTWYAVPEGFALASRLEQFNADGTPKNDPDRWSAKIKAPAIFGLKDAIQAFFTPQEGRYRIIVFIVTNQPFSAADKETSADEARGWVQKGAHNLPQAIREMDYTPEHFCEALIYEFDQSTRDNPAVYKAPSELQGETHLRKARIWSALGG
jgi:hypothetical protein